MFKDSFCLCCRFNNWYVLSWLQYAGNVFASSGPHETEKVLAVDDSESVPAIGGSVEPLASVSTKKSTLDNGVTSDFNIGVYYQKQGDLVKAIESYEKVLSLDPDNAEAHNNLGIIYKEQGSIDKAVEHFQRVVTVKPGDG